MFDLLNLDELHVSVSPLRQVLLVEQPRLFDRNDLVSQTVHNQDPAFHIPYVIDIRKVVLLELDVHLVLVVKHAAQGPDRTLQNAAPHLVFGGRHHCRVGAQTKAPQDHSL